MKTSVDGVPSLSGNNLAEYDRSALSGGYAEEPKLKKAESTILEQIGSEVRNTSILDLGVGAGRTTPFLTKLSSDYLGLDFSPEMVAACRKHFPGVHIIQGDARVLDGLEQGHFGLVCFFWNGIDYVAHEDRQQILRQVLSVLRPGGLFLFASHNLRCRPRRPWNPSLHYWTRSPKALARYVYYSLRWTRNYLRRRALQSSGEGYAILVDEPHDFCLATYFVDPPEQFRQLEICGFEEIRSFDQNGAESAAGDPLGNSPVVHYLARKPRQDSL